MVGYTAIVERLGEERTLGFVRIIYEKMTGACREHGATVHTLDQRLAQAGPVLGVPTRLLA